MKARHHDLDVWRQAISLVKEVYALTKRFPGDEIYGLTSQMRRAAVSVPSNIAEGAARSSRKELIQFLVIARGSLMELETEGVIANELGYMDSPGFSRFKEQIEKVFALLSGFINAVRREASKP